MIDGLFVVKNDYYEDFRGSNSTLFTQNHLEQPKYVQDKITISKPSVLRGLHGDWETDKLMFCLFGFLELLVVDCRKDSPTYKECNFFRLSPKYEDTNIHVFVPAGCANGHFNPHWSEDSLLFYKWSKTYQGPEQQFTLKYNADLDGNPWRVWPQYHLPILSDRDKNGKEIWEL